MSLSQTIAWDIQTGGSSANGGGFNTTAAGTDWSQSATPHTTFNGTTVTASNGSASASIVIAGYTVAATDVGNVVNVILGTSFTPGRYEIVSVATGTSTWNLDRPCTTAAGSGMTGNMGGCLDHLQTALTSAMVADNAAYVKSGTYVLTSALTLPAFGGVKYNTRAIGYSSTHGDQPQGATRPVFATSNSAINGLNANQNAGWRWENLIFDGSGTTKGLIGINMTGASAGDIFNCKITGFASQGILCTQVATIVQTEVTACAGTAGQGAIEASINIRVARCWIHDCARTGIFLSSPGAMAAGNVISNCTGAGSNGITVAYGVILLNNTVYAAAASGINYTDPAAQAYAISQGNLIVNCGAYGMNWSASLAWSLVPVFDYNAFYNNTSGSYHFQTASLHDVSLTGNPFTNAAGNDFTLNATAGAGAAARAMGAPGTVGGLSQSGYSDIGALQHQEVVSSGPVARSMVVQASGSY